MCVGVWMGVSGGQRVILAWPRAIVRYGHIDANALWPRPSCRGCRQKPANVSSSKTHKSQEPCLMAHQHRQKARGHLDGCGLVLCKLTFWGLFTQFVQCEIMWGYDKETEIYVCLWLHCSYNSLNLSYQLNVALEWTLPLNKCTPLISIV